jgi:hypothetical protein
VWPQDRAEGGNGRIQECRSDFVSVLVVEFGDCDENYGLSAASVELISNANTNLSLFEYEQSRVLA